MYCFIKIRDYAICFHCPQSKLYLPVCNFIGHHTSAYNIRATLYLNTKCFSERATCSFMWPIEIPSSGLIFIHPGTLKHTQSIFFLLNSAKTGVLHRICFQYDNIRYYIILISRSSSRDIVIYFCDLQDEFLSLATYACTTTII